MGVIVSFTFPTPDVSNISWHDAISKVKNKTGQCRHDVIIRVGNRITCKI